MAKQRDKRVSDLENRPGSGRDEIRVSVNWRDDGLVLDHDTGEYVTVKEWKRRNPGDRLIIVRCDDEDNEGYDDAQELVPA